MDAKLRERILGNQFSFHLLEHRIDQEAFSELREALRELTRAWQGQTLIDKQVVFILFDTMSVVRNTLQVFREENRRKEADLLEDVFIELDRLIMEECFQAGRQ